jgi:hypothetical protein
MVIAHQPFRLSRHFYQKRTNFRTGSGSCFDLKHGSLMFRLFRKPVSVLDEKSNKTIMRFRIMFQINLKEMRPRFADLSEDEMEEILNETKNNL